MIIFDNCYYDTEGISERQVTQVFSSIERGILGHIQAVQSHVVGNERSYTLLVTKEQRERLRVSCAKTGLLDLIDHEMFGWFAAAGTDNSWSEYSTGVYLSPMTRLIFVPQEGTGDVRGNRWTVDLTFIINSRGLYADGAGGVPSGTWITETPGGTIDGVNDEFTLTQLPDTLFYFKNDLLQTLTVDYTLSGQVITTLGGSIPVPGDVLSAVFLPA